MGLEASCQPNSQRHKYKRIDQRVETRRGMAYRARNATRSLEPATATTFSPPPTARPSRRPLASRPRPGSRGTPGMEPVCPRIHPFKVNLFLLSFRSGTRHGKRRRIREIERGVRRIGLGKGRSRGGEIGANRWLLCSHLYFPL
ncbi:hypothetical protein BHM03_00025847 [Ensete ventricosum]|nr:hypothetical protein BHM03_00025847 [Ensete ventricosum]